MAKPCLLVWRHGWGCNSHYWDGLLDNFSDFESCLYDEGYFSSKIEPKLPQDANLIGIGHSLGFAKLLLMPVKWYKLISICGFTRFAYSNTFKSGITLATIDNMAKGLASSPLRELTKFYRMSKIDYAIDARDINFQPLADDLMLLGNLDLRLSHLSKTKVLSIIASHDPIVKIGISKACFINNKVINHVGHNLGMVKINNCVKLIRKFLEEENVSAV